MNALASGSDKVVPRFHDLYTYEAELQKKEAYIRQLESQLQIVERQVRGVFQLC